MRTVTQQTQQGDASVPQLRKQLVARFAQIADSHVDRATEIPWLALYGRPEPTSPLACLYEPTAAIILQGSKEATLGDETYVYNEERLLVTAVNLPVVCYVTKATDGKPFMGMVVKLDFTTIRQLIVHYDLPAPKGALMARGIGTAPLTLELLQLMSRAFDLLETPQRIPVLSDLLYQEIIYHLLESEQGGRLWQLAMTGSQSQRVQKVINWLQAHYSEPLRVDNLAEMAAMSSSSLRQHFHDMTAMSPLQFQKQLRLQEARRLMLVEDLDAGMAALRVGYESQSQFSREYARQFGQPPMRDIKQLRAESQLEPA